MNTNLLVERCLTGDQGAMVQLVEKYRQRVFGFCFRMLGQRQDAEDTTQETFVRVLRSLGRWDSTRAFEPWLLAIAANRCRTAISRRQRRPAHQMLPDSIHAKPSEDTANALAEEIRFALREVPVNHRQAFLLFHEQELNYAEIAERMDRPVGTIKTWVHRARRQMIGSLNRRGVIHKHQERVS